MRQIEPKHIGRISTSLNANKAASWVRLAVFALVFGGIGTAYLLSTRAATNPSLVASDPASSPYGFTVAEGIDASLVAKYKDLNIFWVRNQVPWDKIETSEDAQGNPIYDWSKLDQEVQLANQNGFIVTFPLQGAPAWRSASPSATCTSLGITLPTTASMTQFAHDVAARYSIPWGQTGSHGYIASYEIGNEEYGRFQLDPADGCHIADNYVPNLEAGYTTIKQANPNAMVGMFGIAWDNMPVVDTFFQRMYDLGAKPYFDFANFHYYNHNAGTNSDPSVVDPKNPNFPTFDQKWQGIYGVMQQNGDGGKKIWVTETGWITEPKVNRPNTPTVTEAQQAQYFTYELNESKASGAIGKFFGYTIATANSLYKDEPEDISPDYPGDTDVANDLAPDNDTAPLAAYNAIKTFVASKPTWANNPVPGDCDGDGHVTIIDLSILLSHYGTSYSACDFNSDGVVDILDLSTLLTNFGT